jgi:hypothetical protein
MSPAELLPQVYDDLRKLAAAGMRHEAVGQPRVNVHFAGESNSAQPHSVGTTAARTGGSPTFFGPIDQRTQGPASPENPPGRPRPRLGPGRPAGNAGA